MATFVREPLAIPTNIEADIVLHELVGRLKIIGVFVHETLVTLLMTGTSKIAVIGIKEREHWITPPNYCQQNS